MSRRQLQIGQRCFWHLDKEYCSVHTSADASLFPGSRSKIPSTISFTRQSGPRPAWISGPTNPSSTSTPSIATSLLAASTALLAVPSSHSLRDAPSFCTSDSGCWLITLVRQMAMSIPASGSMESGVADSSATNTATTPAEWRTSRWALLVDSETMVSASTAAALEFLSADFVTSSRSATTPLVTTSPTVSYTHLRAHETPEHLVCRLLLEKKKKHQKSR
eukprot:TRINITY_DN15071_c0_g1_i8.p1 TRINITY_DN15071_c0_g1~~TRINITY_DN15071_c0_g1_i8.p1  ORF type:complete len:220 (-),score=34.00 TRINITY_DN15071_c0_g1_i8:86-745(-)